MQRSWGVCDSGSYEEDMSEDDWQKLNIAILNLQICIDEKDTKDMCC